MTTSELMKAMADAGAPFEAILIAVQALDAKDAEIAARDAATAEKRARDAERKRAERRDGKGRKRRPWNVRGRSVDCPKDAPIERNIHTHPDISPDGESQAEPARDECNRVSQVWNGMAKATGLPVCSKMTGKRLRACQARLRNDGFDAIRQAIEHVPKSTFLRGDSGKWSGATIDFILKPDSVTSILEGKYDDRKPASQPPTNDEPANPYVRATLARQAERAAGIGGQPDCRP